MKSVMKNQFQQVPSASIQRNLFDRSHGIKTTFDADYLIPFFTDECLPGDTHHLKTTVFARLSTPIHPIMDNIFLDMFYFAVPMRLLWDNWQKFMGEVDATDVLSPPDYLVPTVTAPAGGFVTGSVYDYMACPVGVAGIETDAMYLRAYNLIYNEWFRDQNIIDPLEIDTGDGPDDPNDYTLLKRAKRRDYFTSCLPWPQKGPGVELPLGDYAPVIGNGKAMGLCDKYSSGAFEYALRGTNAEGIQLSGEGFGKTLPYEDVTGWDVPHEDYVFGLTEVASNSGVIADLSSATAATINSIRQAFQLQKMLERDARGGSRYVEIIKSHFGVVSPDYRLQRPEYLGGLSMRVNVSAVAKTGSTDGESPQGNLAAIATAGGYAGGYNKSFTEHSIIIGIANVRADITYQQGLPRRYSRQTRYDYYWPSLAHLGEQEVLSKEIYCDGTSADDDVFGYQERYAEYRYESSKITGLFRSNPTGGAASLDVWHLSQDFASRPTLNQAFIESDTDLDRVIAVPSEPQVIFDAYMDLKSVRPLPIYSVPGKVDHF